MNNNDDDCQIVPELTGWACICNNDSSVALTQFYKILAPDRVIRIVECRNKYGLVEETEHGPIIARILVSEYPSYDEARIGASAYETVFEKLRGVQ
ncbi:MAG: hypothetical protein ACYDG3_13410 [Bacillati bacterium]